jgi:hypothetical protein
MPGKRPGMTVEIGTTEVLYFVNFENAFTTCS